MDPVTAEPDFDLSAAEDEQELEFQIVGGEEDEDLEDDEDEDDEEDDDDDDDDEDDEDDEDDDDVATDEDGKEMLRIRTAQAAGRISEDEPQAAPNVDSDRVPATDAEPEGSLDKVKTAPLGIKEIENLEDDARGG